MAILRLNPIMKKKLMALLMIVLFIVSIVPVGVFGEGEECSADQVLNNENECVDKPADTDTTEPKPSPESVSSEDQTTGIDKEKYDAMSNNLFSSSEDGKSNRVDLNNQENKELVKQILKDRLKINLDIGENINEAYIEDGVLKVPKCDNSKGECSLVLSGGASGKNIKTVSENGKYSIIIEPNVVVSNGHILEVTDKGLTLDGQILIEGDNVEISSTSKGDEKGKYTVTKNGVTLELTAYSDKLDIKVLDGKIDATGTFKLNLKLLDKDISIDNFAGTLSIKYDDKGFSISAEKADVRVGEDRFVGSFNVSYDKDGVKEFLLNKDSSAEMKRSDGSFLHVKSTIDPVKGKRSDKVDDIREIEATINLLQKLAFKKDTLTPEDKEILKRQGIDIDKPETYSSKIQFLRDKIDKIIDEESGRARTENSGVVLFGNSGGNLDLTNTLQGRLSAKIESSDKKPLVSMDGKDQRTTFTLTDPIDNKDGNVKAKYNVYVSNSKKTADNFAYLEIYDPKGEKNKEGKLSFDFSKKDGIISTSLKTNGLFNAPAFFSKDNMDSISLSFASDVFKGKNGENIPSYFKSDSKSLAVLFGDGVTKGAEVISLSDLDSRLREIEAKAGLIGKTDVGTKISDIEEAYKKASEKNKLLDVQLLYNTGKKDEAKAKLDDIIKSGDVNDKLNALNAYANILKREGKKDEPISKIDEAINILEKIPLTDSNRDDINKEIARLKSEKDGTSKVTSADNAKLTQLTELQRSLDGLTGDAKKNNIADQKKIAEGLKETDPVLAYQTLRNIAEKEGNVADVEKYNDLYRSAILGGLENSGFDFDKLKYRYKDYTGMIAEADLVDARIYLEKHDADSAIKKANDVIDIYGKNNDAKLIIAEAYYSKKDDSSRSKSKEILGELLKEGDTRTKDKSLVILGQISLSENNIDKAKQLLNQVSEKNKDSLGVNKLLSDIKTYETIEGLDEEYSKLMKDHKKEIPKEIRDMVVKDGKTFGQLVEEGRSSQSKEVSEFNDALKDKNIEKLQSYIISGKGDMEITLSDDKGSQKKVKLKDYVKELEEQSKISQKDRLNIELLQLFVNGEYKNDKYEPKMFTFDGKEPEEGSSLYEKAFGSLSMLNVARDMYWKPLIAGSDIGKGREGVLKEQGLALATEIENLIKKGEAGSFTEALKIIESKEGIYVSPDGNMINDGTGSFVTYENLKSYADSSNFISIVKKMDSKEIDSTAFYSSIAEEARSKGKHLTGVAYMSYTSAIDTNGDGTLSEDEKKAGKKFSDAQDDMLGEGWFDFSDQTVAMLDLTNPDTIYMLGEGMTNVGFMAGTKAMGQFLSYSGTKIGAIQVGSTTIGETSFVQAGKTTINTLGKAEIMAKNKIESLSAGVDNTAGKYAIDVMGKGTIKAYDHYVGEMAIEEGGNHLMKVFGDSVGLGDNPVYGTVTELLSENLKKGGSSIDYTVDVKNLRSTSTRITKESAGTVSAEEFDSLEKNIIEVQSKLSSSQELYRANEISKKDLLLASENEISIRDNYIDTIHDQGIISTSEYESHKAQVAVDKASLQYETAREDNNRLIESNNNAEWFEQNSQETFLDNKIKNEQDTSLAYQNYLQAKKDYADNAFKNGYISKKQREYIDSELQIESEYSKVLDNEIEYSKKLKNYEQTYEESPNNLENEFALKKATNERYKVMNDYKKKETEVKKKFLEENAKQLEESKSLKMGIPFIGSVSLPTFLSPSKMSENKEIDSELTKINEELNNLDKQSKVLSKQEEMYQNFDSLVKEEEGILDDIESVRQDDIESYVDVKSRYQRLVGELSVLLEDENDDKDEAIAKLQSDIAEIDEIDSMVIDNSKSYFDAVANGIADDYDTPSPTETTTPTTKIINLAEERAKRIKLAEQEVEENLEDYIEEYSLQEACSVCSLLKAHVDAFVLTERKSDAITLLLEHSNGNPIIINTYEGGVYLEFGDYALAVDNYDEALTAIDGFIADNPGSSSAIQLKESILEIKEEIEEKASESVIDSNIDYNYIDITNPPNPEDNEHSALFNDAFTKAEIEFLKSHMSDSKLMERLESEPKIATLDKDGNIVYNEELINAIEEHINNDPNSQVTDLRLKEIINDKYSIEIGTIAEENMHKDFADNKNKDAILDSISTHKDFIDMRSRFLKIYPSYEGMSEKDIAEEMYVKYKADNLADGLVGFVI